MAFLNKDDTYKKIDDNTVVVSKAYDQTLKKSELLAERLMLVNEIAKIDEQLELWEEDDE